MTVVVTLIAAPDSCCLTDDIVKQCRQNAGINSSAQITWLAPEEACSMTLVDGRDDEAPHVKEIIQGAVAHLPVDVHLIPAEPGRPDALRKKLLVADMESTIIQEELIDELAALTGTGEQIAAITAQAMRGELDFADALRSRVAQFNGLDAALLEDLYRTSVTWMPGAQTLIKTMKAHGATTALVSGGFTTFTARVADQLGFDSHRGNTLEIAEGKLTGHVLPPIIDRAAKAAALKDLATQLRLSNHETMAVGDGANDLDMLEAAGLGVAFRGKPVVIDAADIAITHGDLTSLLYVQGYRRQDFVGATEGA